MAAGLARAKPLISWSACEELGLVALGLVALGLVALGLLGAAAAQAIEDATAR